MSDLIEIRWHGRGGQGTVTAAKVLADAALSGGRHVQAFPEYGPERAGAPLRAYNRIGDRPLRLHCPVTRPNIIMVVDVTLLDGVNVTDGAKDDAIFIINSPRDPKEIKQKLSLSNNQKVFTVDATKISLETIGRALPNSCMLGALAKASNIIPLDILLEDVRASFGKKFSSKIIEANIEATRRGYNELKAG